MSRILHYELTRIARDMKEAIHEVNRPLASVADGASPWYMRLALDNLRRITERQVEERVRELRRSILGADLGGALCGDVIRVRPPMKTVGMGAMAEASPRTPQEAS